MSPRTLTRTAAALALAASLAACGGSDSTTAASAPSAPPTADAPETDDVAKLAAVAKAVRADPSSYDVVLGRHHMTPEEFEAALYDVASDPEKSARFQAALQ